MNKADTEMVRQVVAEHYAGTVSGIAERIVVERVTEKVAHAQGLQRDAETKAEEARQLEAGYRQRTVAAEGQLKDLRIDIADAQHTLDDIRIETADLATRRDELVKEVGDLENQFKVMSVNIAEKKLARIR